MDLGGDQERITSPFTLGAGSLKSASPTPCYILVDISIESIPINSPSYSLLGIQCNHSAGEPRSKTEKS
jgi:hypothetical protein